MPEYKDKKQVQRREDYQQSTTPLQQKKEQNPYQFYMPPLVTSTPIQLKDIDRSVIKPATGKYAEQHHAMIQRFGLRPLETSNEQTAPIQKKENKTGLPDNLKSGVESLSGMSMDDVKVHYNSSKPSQLQAHAYAQGTDIHVASGQEKHLPHEAWHVAQQKQGRVKPTMQMNGVAVNDDKGLEREADVMGSKAVQMKQNASTESIQTTNGNKVTQLVGEEIIIAVAQYLGVAESVVAIAAYFGLPVMAVSSTLVAFGVLGSYGAYKAVVYLASKKEENENAGEKNDKKKDKAVEGAKKKVGKVEEMKKEEPKMEKVKKEEPKMEKVKKEESKVKHEEEIGMEEPKIKLSEKTIRFTDNLKKVLNKLDNAYEKIELDCEVLLGLDSLSEEKEYSFLENYFSNWKSCYGEIKNNAIDKINKALEGMSVDKEIKECVNNINEHIKESENRLIKLYLDSLSQTKEERERPKKVVKQYPKNSDAPRYNELNDQLKGGETNDFESELLTTYYPSGKAKGHPAHGSSKDRQYSVQSQLKNFMKVVDSGSKEAVAKAIYKDFGFHPG